MESRAKFAGYPAHPILVVFPLVLLLTSFIFDIAFLLKENPTMAIVAYWMLTVGLLWGVVAAIPGLIDWLATPAATRARQMGLYHAVGNAAVLLLFGLSWWLRTNEPQLQPPALALAGSLVASGLAGLTGWLGGELIDRLSVDPDAPSSLSGRSASEMSR